MKITFLILTIVLGINVIAQDIFYTHRTTRIKLKDAAIVVPETGGMNHLWIVSENQSVKLHVYNQQLEWQQELQAPFRLPLKSNVTILPLKNQYYFYKEGGPGSFLFYKVYPDGRTTDVSGKLTSVIESTFKDTSVECELFNVGESIYLLANLYYPRIKKITTTILQLNSDLEPQLASRLSFDFDHRAESIVRMAVAPGNNITILLRHMSEEGKNILDVVQLDFEKGRTRYATFNSYSRFNAPDILLNAADSSTTIYAQMGRSFTSGKVIRNVFFASLTDTLSIKKPPTVIKVPIEDEMYGAFTYINVSDACNRWLPIHGTWNMITETRNNTQRIFVGLSAMVSSTNNITYVVNASSYKPVLQAIDPYQQFISQAGDVKFTVIDKNFNNTYDTTIKYRRKNFIEVSQYAGFSMNSKNYLLVKEQFPSNGKALLLLYVNKEGFLNSSPIRLYDKYHYSIAHLQKGAKNIICPYLYKGEVGLVNFGFHVND